MPATMLRVLLAGFFALCLGGSTLWADARSDAFLTALTQALDSGDRQKVAGMMEFPATVISSGFNIPIKGRTALAALYDGVFTRAVRCAIAESAPTPSGAKPRRPAVLSGDALSFAGGLVSARAVGNTFKITRMTVVSGAAEGKGTTQRVAFRPAPTGRTAQLAGRLSGAPDVYTVALNAREVLDARIEGFAGRNAVIRAIAPAQTAARPPVPDNANRLVHVVAAETGDYQLEVVRLSSPCDADVTYRMTVSVR